MVDGILITRTHRRIAVGNVDYAIRAAFTAPPMDECYDVICHGSWTRDRLTPLGNSDLMEMDADQLAAIIRAQPDYAGQPVRLLACWVGQHSDGFAHRLDNLLGHSGVFACTGRVMVEYGKAYAEPGYCWQLFQYGQVEVVTSIP
jgi:hypothetical protein